MSNARSDTPQSADPIDPIAELTIAASERAASQALRAGARAPLFTLSTFDAKQIALEDVLEDGPVILQFRRGSWCTYGQDGANELALAHRDVLALGASVLAIEPPCKFSPTNDTSSIPVLLDVDMRASRAYGLAFELPVSLRERYTRLGYVPPRDGKPETWLVPLPATYLLDRDGVIVLSFIDVDYRNHCGGEQILDALKALNTRRPTQPHGRHAAP
ncbi:peroxiredoxin-like family protein [Paraburkholderia sp. DHOC27]|uniref:peroxiredoxin-like family protein n=1 Tax=Paraburkholderia sp. DHOC27 TaxID=2303330 RepID=UPI000E3E5FC6|nr:peroxiredoxin-like family protein [Paraburkholderia sp. DHOC27]RFU49304.1 AhpC/TSA family protein [Paraburkholderia sp. DHOC27]